MPYEPEAGEPDQTVYMNISQRVIPVLRFFNAAFLQKNLPNSPFFSQGADSTERQV